MDNNTRRSNMPVETLHAQTQWNHANLKNKNLKDRVGVNTDVNSLLTNLSAHSELSKTLGTRKPYPVSIAILGPVLLMYTRKWPKETAQSKLGIFILCANQTLIVLCTMYRLWLNSLFSTCLYALLTTTQLPNISLSPTYYYLLLNNHLYLVMAEDTRGLHWNPRCTCQNTLPIQKLHESFCLTGFFPRITHDWCLVLGMLSPDEPWPFGEL